MTMVYSKRFYRSGLCPAGMTSFRVSVKETDLWIAVEEHAYHTELPQQVEQLVWSLRRQLEKYILQEPYFAKTMHPVLVDAGAPMLVQEMVRAGNRAGVGPMAAVAGAFAQRTGEWLRQHSGQVIVENGGDIFCCTQDCLRVGVFAGASPFSGRLSIRVEPQAEPRGICTSSGTVGPSHSEGRADAAIIVASCTLLADAVATATANSIQWAGDLENSLQLAKTLPEVSGVLAILGDKMAAWGDIQLEQV